MKNETNHTPGAWEIRMPKEGICKESKDRITIGADGKHVATIHTGGMPYKPSREAVANAHLMAAAPEMLRLLADGAEMLDKLTGDNLAVYSRTFAALARVAIAKAKGGPHE